MPIRCDQETEISSRLSGGLIYLLRHWTYEKRCYYFEFGIEARRFYKRLSSLPEHIICGAVARRPVVIPDLITARNKHLSRRLVQSRTLRCDVFLPRASRAARVVPVRSFGSRASK